MNRAADRGRSLRRWEPDQARRRALLLVAAVALGACDGEATPTTGVAAASSTVPVTTAPEPTTTTATGGAGTTTEAPPPTTTPSTAAPTAWTIESYPVPRAPTPTTSPRPPTAASGTPPRASGALGRLDPATGETRHDPAGRRLGAARRDRRPRRRRLGHRRRAQRHRPGRPRRRARSTRLPPAAGRAATPTSTRPPSTATASSGSPGRTASTAGSTRRPARWRSSTRPRGPGPTASPPRPTGEVYYASLAGSHIARIDAPSGEAEVLEPPTAGPGRPPGLVGFAGPVWVSEWNTGQVSRYDPAERDAGRSGDLPGDGRQAYAVYVDERDTRLAERLRRQRHRPLRPGDRDVHRDPPPSPPRQRAPAPRPARRGVGAASSADQLGGDRPRLNRFPSLLEGRGGGQNGGQRPSRADGEGSDGPRPLSPSVTAASTRAR